MAAGVALLFSVSGIEAGISTVAGVLRVVVSTGSTSKTSLDCKEDSRDSATLAMSGIVGDVGGSTAAVDLDVDTGEATGGSDVVSLGAASSSSAAAVASVLENRLGVADGLLGLVVDDEEDLDFLGVRFLELLLLFFLVG